MLNGKVGVSGPQPEPSTSSPANCVAWAEFQSAIDQADGWIDLWFKVSKDVGHVAEDFGIVPCCLKCATSKTNADFAILLPILAPEISVEKHMTRGRSC